MKRIAVDLAKSVYQIAESVRAGEVTQRKRLNRVAFARYVQEQVGPVEWVMEACGGASGAGERGSGDPAAPALRAAVSAAQQDRS